MYIYAVSKVTILWETGKNKLDLPSTIFFLNNILANKQNVALCLKLARKIDRITYELDLLPKVSLAGLSWSSWEYCNLADKANPDDKCE
jgi:hypothetical protein